MTREQQLFSLYVSLGESRSLERLAEATGKSESYLRKLSAKHKWQERLIQDTALLVEEVKSYYRDREVNKIEQRSSLAERVYKMIEEGLANVSVENARDVKTMLEVYALLTGKPTQITQDVTTLPTDNLTDEELSALAELVARTNPTQDKTYN